MSAPSIRLSVMMFLQFFVWGAWYVTAPRFLGTIGFSPGDFGWTYSVGPIAGMISPFLVGMIADRFFATERVLGTLHVIGGVVMLAATTQMGTSGASPTIINAIFFAHMLCYFPTLALSNSLALHTMTDAEKEFPMIRVFGTIGWIAAGLLIGWQQWGSTVNQFYLAGGVAILLGLYCFTLPHTPPPLKGQEVSARQLLGLDAFALFKNRSFLIFMVSSFLICIPLAFYYQMAERSVYQAGVTDTPTKMTYGQMSEIIFMVLMPFFFKRLGVKWMLLIGMAAWVVRYGLFTAASPASANLHWMLILGIVLHGICYDFFFVTGQIYTDKVAPTSIRSQAQGMLVLFTLGFGMLIGAQVAGYIEAKNTPPEAEQLQAEMKPLQEQLTQLEEQQQSADGADADPTIQTQIDDLRASIDGKNLAMLQTKDWPAIWLLPCIAAAVIMVLFGLLFREPTGTTETTAETDA